MTIQDIVAFWQAQPFRPFRVHTTRGVFEAAFPLQLGLTAWMGVAQVPGSSFFPTPEHRFVRLNFAKPVETLHAAGERRLKLRRG